MDYLLRQIHMEALHRREEFTEVIYLRTRIRILFAFRVIDQLRVKATRVSDLAAELRDSLPTVARLVQQLEPKGWSSEPAMRRMPVLDRTTQSAWRRAGPYNALERQDHITLCLEDWSDEQLGELLPCSKS